MTLRFPIFCALAAVVGFPAVSQALVVRTPNAAAHNRFVSGYPTDPVVNASASFLLAGFDLSGIGWNAANPGQSFTLVTPQHFVGATHSSIGGGGVVEFVGSDGVKRSYVVESAVAVPNAEGRPSDLFVGRLSAPIAQEDRIRLFPVTGLAEAQQTGATAYLYGNAAKVGTGTIGAFQNFGDDPLTAGAGLSPTRTFTTTYRPIGGRANDARFEGGDSGSPTFLVENGTLALAGVHGALQTTSFATLTTYTNYDTSVSFYINEVNNILAADGYQLTVVPEPRAIFLLLVAVGGIAVVGRNRLRDPAR